jgi:spermidine/putrescine ABC transporter ATP-binding subunit
VDSRLKRVVGNAAVAQTSAAALAGAAIGLIDLEKRFDNVGAVLGLSLDIRAGEFITLLGPSGSGKTTTLMMIAGFETPSAGEITIDGRSIVATPPYRRDIGMVFQSYALFPHMTVAENIGFPLRQRRTSAATTRAEVDRALEMVRMPGYGARYPRQLSGGQQQRVALARAVVFHPRVLLMDEPLGALDKQLRDSMQLEIRRLHTELGITFVYVTHDQEEALVMSDRIAVMDAGRLEQIGSPEELYDRPANRFVASFIGESNFLSAIAVGTEDGVAWSDVCGQRIGAAAAAAPPGAAVTLAVRPERLAFADAPQDAAARINMLRAVVRDIVFVGETTRTVVEVEGGTMLVVKQLSRAGPRRHAPGDPVLLRWAVEDTLVV